MKPAEEYLEKAKNFEARAVATQSCNERIAYEVLARAYRKLAGPPRQYESKAKN